MGITVTLFELFLYYMLRGGSNFEFVSLEPCLCFTFGLLLLKSCNVFQFFLLTVNHTPFVDVIGVSKVLGRCH